jgi:hypothetical protein
MSFIVFYIVHKEELDSFYLSPNVNKIRESCRMGWARKVAGMGR